MCGAVVASVSVRTVRGRLLRRLSSFFFLDRRSRVLVGVGVKKMVSHYRCYFSHAGGGCCSYSNRACFGPCRDTRCAVFLCFFTGAVSRSASGHLLTSGLCCLGGVVGKYSLCRRMGLPRCFALSRPINDIVKQTRCNRKFDFKRGYAIKGGGKVCPILNRGIQVYTGSSVVNGYQVNSGIVVKTGSNIGSRSIPSGSVIFKCSPRLVVGTGQ